AAEAAAPRGEEVVDLPGGDVRLELRERGARVGAVEAADRHHGTSRGELDARGAVGADRRRRPGRGRVLLEQLDEGGVGREGVEQTAETALTPAAEALRAARLTGDPGRGEALLPLAERLP